MTAVSQVFIQHIKRGWGGVSRSAYILKLKFHMQKKKLNQKLNKIPDEWICVVYDREGGWRGDESAKWLIFLFSLCVL